MKKIIYFDNAASTQIDPKVLEAMMPFFTKYYANPSNDSNYMGLAVKRAVKKSWHKMENFFGIHSRQIILTSGATESINLWFTGLKNYLKNKTILTLSTEHSAVLKSVDKITKTGIQNLQIGVRKNGVLDWETLEKMMKQKPFLVSVALVNNETGCIQPVREIFRLCKKNGCLLFVDATQAIGKLDFDFSHPFCDAFVGSGHKIHGPKGIGFLCCLNSKIYERIEPIIVGGNQQNNKRAGTLNVAGIVGLTHALEMALEYGSNNVKKIREITKELKHFVASHPKFSPNTLSQYAVEHIFNFSIKKVKAKEIITQFGQFAFSTGSACSTNLSRYSHVLKAMNKTKEEMEGAVRISFSKFNTYSEVQQLMHTLQEKFCNM